MKDYLTIIRDKLDPLFLPGETSTTLFSNIQYVFDKLKEMTKHLTIPANAAQEVSSQEVEVLHDDTEEIPVVQETQANLGGDIPPPQSQQHPPAQIASQASAPKQPDITDVFALLKSMADR